jgi:hypothetical protein
VTDERQTEDPTHYFSLAHHRNGRRVRAVELYRESASQPAIPRNTGKEAGDCDRAEGHAVAGSGDGSSAALPGR